ncbi:hypothetical protein Tco_0483554 [Tanacetum coccineum]
MLSSSAAADPPQCERAFVEMQSWDGGDQGFQSAVSQKMFKPSVPVTKPVEAEVPKPKRSKKKRVIYDSEGLPVVSLPPQKIKPIRDQLWCPSLEGESVLVLIAVASVRKAVAAETRNLSLSSEQRGFRGGNPTLVLRFLGLEATETHFEASCFRQKTQRPSEQECNSLKLKVTGLESTIAEKDHELSDLGASSSSLKS